MWNIGKRDLFLYIVHLSVFARFCCPLKDSLSMESSGTVGSQQKLARHLLQKG